MFSVGPKNLIQTSRFFTPLRCVQNDLSLFFDTLERQLIYLEGRPMLIDKPVSKFLNELASNTPAPGGGSVAALAGAVGAALASMVCNLTIGKKKYAEVQDEMKTVLEQTEQLRKELTGLIDKDTEAFNAVMAAFGLPKGTEQEQAARSSAIQEATKAATLIPLSVMRACEKGLRHARTVAQKGNKNSASDAGVAALMLQAGCAGAALNVRINLGGLNDATFVQQIAEKSAILSQSVEKLTHEVLTEVEKSLWKS
jgi:formiminotetrahydrofolate cyclodeaminase